MKVIRFIPDEYGNEKGKVVIWENVDRKTLKKQKKNGYTTIEFEFQHYQREWNKMTTSSFRECTSATVEYVTVQKEIKEILKLYENFYDTSCEKINRATWLRYVKIGTLKATGQALEIKSVATEALRQIDSLKKALANLQVEAAKGNSTDSLLKTVNHVNENVARALKIANYFLYREETTSRPAPVSRDRKKVCDYCLQAIQSHGEKVVICGKAWEGNCDFCGETDELTYIKFK